MTNHHSRKSNGTGLSLQILITGHARVKTMAVYGPQRTSFPPSRISQTDGLRYEREYSVVRIGEDLPESINGNRGL